MDGLVTTDWGIYETVANDETDERLVFDSYTDFWNDI
jgi:hypothetical protein